jgi:hypothetical protein
VAKKRHLWLCIKDNEGDTTYRRRSTCSITFTLLVLFTAAH